MTDFLLAFYLLCVVITLTRLLTNLHMTSRDGPSQWFASMLMVFMPVMNIFGAAMSIAAWYDEFVRPRSRG